MEFIHKIRALQIGKRKTFRRVLLAEILLILLGLSVCLAEMRCMNIRPKG